MSTVLYMSIVVGAIGLWVALMTLFGGLNNLIQRLFGTKTALDMNMDEKNHVDDDVSDIRKWPLAARWMHSLAGVGKKEAPNNKDLMVRLMQSGFVFASPAQYYYYQVALALMMGAGFLAVMIILSTTTPVSPMLIILVSFALGMIGAMLPESQVKSAIKKRQDDLRLDMTFQLPRFILLLESTGNMQSAIKSILESAERQDIPTKKAEERRKAMDALTQEYQIELGMSLTGFGGNLFAELINRIAQLLQQQAKPEAIMEDIENHFKMFPALSEFLTVIQDGLRGHPMKDNLVQLSEQLRKDLNSILKDSSTKAVTVTTLGTGIALIALMAIFLAPMLQSVALMF